MGKKNIGRKSKAAKSSKSIASPKPSKSFSLSGETLASVITSPVVRELAADVLIAIAGAITANRTGTTEPSRSANASDASRAAQTATGAVAGVMVEAARRILPSSPTGGTEDQGRGSARSDDAPRALAARPNKPRKPRAGTPRET